MKLEVGQMWKYGNQNENNIIILKIESRKGQDIVHIAIDGIGTHFPVEKEVVLREVTELISENNPLPDYEEGYKQWSEAFDNGSAGVFTTPVNEIISFLKEVAEEDKIITEKGTSIIDEFIKLTGYEVEVIATGRDDQWIANRYLELLAEFKNGSKFPMVVSLDDIFMEKIELDLEDEDLEVNLENFKKIVDMHLSDSLNVDIEKVFPSKTKEEIISEMKFKKLKKVGEDHNLELISIKDYDGNIKENLVIVKLDIKNPYEVFAYLPIGGFNDCPTPNVMVAVSKYWYEKFGAVPSAVSYDEVEYYIEKRFTDIDLIKELAAEHFLYDVDIVDQVVGTFKKLAGCFYDNNQWYFWWD